MNYIILKLIKFYQSYLSPVKKHRCAYSVYYCTISCSAYGEKIIQKYGWSVFFPLMIRRFQKCKKAESFFIGNKKSTKKSGNEVACCCSTLPF